MDGYDHQTGIMDPDLMERCIDKIRDENPHAIVFLYGNSEPFLHPRLAECIASVKRRGLNCQLSTNLNFIRNVDEVLAARPDMIIISLSGFTQEVYVKGHAGGNIEKVKANMRVLGEAYGRTDGKTNISVNYHVYRDNEHEKEDMREFAKNLGLGFFTSFARAISMENAIQYLRDRDPHATPFVKVDGLPDYNAMLPPSGDTYKAAMERLVIPPQQAVDIYENTPKHRACPIGTMFCYIRHDGKAQMCACTADRRLTLGNYLDHTQDELTDRRMDHPVCQQCGIYRMREYFHLVSPEQWTK
jgi:MoaA/NifB/PqqE/SkfB family radical SAM enzyme